MPHVAYSFLRPQGPVGPRIAPAWPLPGQHLDLPSSRASVDRCVPGPSSPTPGIGRSGTPVPLGYVIVAAIQRRGPFHSGCCPFAAGRAIWSDAGPAEVIRQAGDQDCCGVEVRGFEPHSEPDGDGHQLDRRARSILSDHEPGWQVAEGGAAVCCRRVVTLSIQVWLPRGTVFKQAW
jgi:hypothetical protein